jgi:uncharacterized membrane protein
MPRILALAILLATLAVAHAAFEWRDVIHEVVIAADGSVVVRDERTLWTNESFGEAFICIEHDQRERLTLLDGSGALSPDRSATAFTQACSDGTAGTEIVVRYDARIREGRVVFHYRLDGALDVYADVVQFYRNLEQRRHPPIVGYRALIQAPGAMREPFDAFVMRYANPERPRVTLSDDRSLLTIAFDRIPDGDGVEVRYLMDPRLFTTAGIGRSLEALLRDQARISNVEERNVLLRTLQTHPLWVIAPLAALLYLIVGIVTAYLRTGREPRVEAMRYPFEPPSDLPPAAVTALLQQEFSPASMGPGWLATILDLARRGFIRLQGDGRTTTLALEPLADLSALDGFEAGVLSYLRRAEQGRRRSSGAMTLRDLESYGLRHARAFLYDWGPRVRKWVEGNMGGPLTSAESRAVTRRWVIRSGVVAGANMLLAFALDGTAGAAAVVGAFASGVALVIAAVSLPSWRPEVAREVAAWQGFKRTLSDYTRMKDAPADFFLLWDRYFVYAAALGVAERYLRAMERVLPLRGLDGDRLIRQATWMGAMQARDVAGLTRAARSLSASLARSGASASRGGSSSGGGGGRSGGGSSGGR